MRRRTRIVAAALLVGLLAVAALSPAGLARDRRGVDGRARTHARAALGPLGVQPDIIFVLVDDLGAIDGRLWPYWPSIQRLRGDGVDFVDFHGETPLCCPARAGFLTGQHTHNHGVTDNVAAMFNPSMSLATQLQGAGYRTVLLGKYLNAVTQNGTFRLKVPFPAPGWSEFTIMAHPADYYRYRLLSNVTAPQQTGVVNAGTFKPCRRPKAADHTSAGVATVCFFDYGTSTAQRTRNYSTNVLAKLSVDAVRRTPATQPLFLEISTAAPHVSGGGFGMPAAPEDASGPTCAGVPNWKDAAYNEADVTDKPAYVAASPLGPDAGYSLVQTCRVMQSVDRLVAQVRAAQEARGRWDQTIFIFAGDNGMNYFDHRLESKWAPYHTDIPFVLFSPLLDPNRHVVRERVQNIDLAPTLCEIAGCSLGPYPNGQARPDGVSFLPLLAGTATGLGRDAVLDDLSVTSAVVDNPPWKAITTTAASPLASQGCALAGNGGCRWHYIEYGSGERELYDVTGGPCGPWRPGDPGDPCELANLLVPATGEPRDPALQPLVESLHQRLDELAHERG